MKRSFLSTALSLLVASTLAAQAAPAKAAPQTPAKSKPVATVATKPAAAAAAATPAVAKKDTATAHARRTDGTTVTTDQIKQSQQALTDKGLYKGKVTGRLNGDFRKAIKAFQTQNQLKATGRLNQETLAKLNIH